jgi:hypothetical protein
MLVVFDVKVREPCLNKPIATQRCVLVPDVTGTLDFEREM